MASDRATTVLDLHGLLTIALADAGPSDVKAIARQLGPLPRVTGAGREPDITIRFVDRVDVQGPLRLLGREAAAGDDEFFVLRGRRKTTVRVKIPVADIGTTPLEIVAERGLSAVPYLLPIVMLTLLSKGTVPIHASAFVAGGRGTLVTGWAKGGKSEALLAFADRGATYVGDEWVFVTADGATMAGLPEPMRLWDWQLAMVPRLRGRIGLGRRARLGNRRVDVAAARRHGPRAGHPLVGSRRHGPPARGDHGEPAIAPDPAGTRLRRSGLRRPRATRLGRPDRELDGSHRRGRTNRRNDPRPPDGRDSRPRAARHHAPSTSRTGTPSRTVATS